MNNNLVVTLGCRLNYWESNRINNLMEESGKQNILVLNTCSVTNQAIKNSVKKINSLRKKFPNAKIVVTGCGVESDYKLFKSLPAVSEILKNKDKLSMTKWKSIKNATRNNSKEYLRDFPMKENPSNSNVRKFVKIQNGCDHSCTFCIIPSCRGKSISEKTFTINKEISDSLKKGVKEVILTGVDITSWGQDFDDTPTLGDLVERILSKNKNLKRLRLSSIDIAEFDEKMIHLIANDERLMPHFHFSLQSLDDMVLKRMKRRHNVNQILKLFEKIRKLSPSVTFGGDFITGFPTETEQMFLNTFNLVKELKISHLHVFPFAARKGTPAARMPQVPLETRRERAKLLRQQGKENFLKILYYFAKKKHRILVENENGFGRTENNLLVRVNSLSKGSIVNVRPKNINKEKLLLY